MLLIVGLFLTTSLSADEASGGTTLCQLRRMSACELEQLFAGAEVGEPPCGCYRGHILLYLDKKWPRLRARADGAIWRGKCFHGDGSFINQFPGFRALASHGGVGPSWLDGRPCLVLEYPSGTPLFGNNRDEIRQVGCGLYLVRLYERCPCPKPTAYLALEARCR
jgi:hypothetical protein